MENHKNLENVCDMCYLNYDLNLENNKTVNFLYDYSKQLNKNKLKEDKIFLWQKNHSLLLKQMGITFNVNFLIKHLL